MGRVAAALREKVHRANVELAGSGLVMGTFGNVSGVDRARGSWPSSRAGSWMMS